MGCHIGNKKMNPDSTIEASTCRLYLYETKGQVINKLKFSFLNLKSNYIMKRAKILLAAIAIFGVVGGALAFKAKGVSSIYCGNTCPELIQAFTTQNQLRGSATTVCNAQGTNIYYKDGTNCTSTTIAYTTDF